MRQQQGFSCRILATTAGIAAALPQITAAPPARASFGKAKSVVVLYLYGAPSQMDTLDPKPDGPVERRGEFGTIASRLPGVRICEHLPRIAPVLNRTAEIVVRGYRQGRHEIPAKVQCPHE